MADARGERGLPPALRRLVLATGISNGGDGIRLVAIPWLASALTRDPALIALSGVATTAGWPVFSIIAGGMVDRIDRRRLIVRMYAVQLVVTLAIALAVLVAGTALVGVAPPAADGLPWLGLLLTAAFILSLAEVARDIAAQAFVPEIVDADRLERANGLQLTAELVANRFIGAPLGGLLLAIALFLPFAVDAATFLVAGVLVLTISAGPRRAAPSASRGFGADLVVGARFLWRHRVVRALTLSATAYNLVTAATFSTLVLYAQEVLGADPLGFGLLTTGGALGGLAAGAIGGRLTDRFARGTLLVGSMVGIGLANLVLAMAPAFAVAWVAFVIPGFLGMTWNIVARSLRQRLTPAHLQGRVLGIHRTLNFGALPAGGLLGGLLVTVAEAPLGRDLALRLPFIVAAVGVLAIAPYVLRQLSPGRVEDAACAVAMEVGG